MIFSNDTPTNQTITNVSGILDRIGHTFFNAHAFIVLVISLSAAIVLGRILAAVLRRIVQVIGWRADMAENLQSVNRLRRMETLIVLSTAIIRTLLILFALYFWWVYVHPGGQPTALVGASALLAIILGGALSPALRDIAFGSVMMAEHWYGVGDHVRIEPFADIQGVVERVTLRSTRIRGLNGEVTWVNNQNIQAVSIAPKGIRTLGVELFVTDPDMGEKLIELCNQRLPQGPLLVVSPLAIVSDNQVGPQLWHITAIAETAPGREWMIENYAIRLLKEIDAESKHPILDNDPIARYADSDAERRFTRTISNARKPVAKKRQNRMAAAHRTLNKTTRRTSKPTAKL